MKLYTACLLSLTVALSASGDSSTSNPPTPKPLLDWYGCGFRNPCGKSSDLFYYPSLFPQYFVQCGQLETQCYYQLCRTGTVWNQTLLTCVYDPSVPPPNIVLPVWPQTPLITGTYDCEDENPCTVENANEHRFYFPHKNPDNFVQCDNFQDCFLMNCPAGEVWDAASYTCDRPPAP